MFSVPGFLLDCCFVGSLDFNFLETQGFFNPQKVKLFAEESTATNSSCSHGTDLSRPPLHLREKNH